MKVLVFLCSCLFSATAFAQLSEDDLKQKIKKAIINNKQENKKAPIVFQKLYSDTTAHSQVLVAGQKMAPGVYRLKQDGMLCIVPDTKGLAPIPNAFVTAKSPYKTQIPNAWGTQPPMLPPTSKK